MGGRMVPIFPNENGRAVAGRTFGSQIARYVLHLSLFLWKQGEGGSYRALRHHRIRHRLRGQARPCDRLSHLPMPTEMW
jgi:hypothetical protein